MRRGQARADHDLPHDLIGDPAFVDATREDYHLAAGLAAIDQGEQAGVTVDMDGQSRPDESWL